MTSRTLGMVLAWVFLLSLTGFIISLLWWLVAMLRGRDPHRPRRVCLTCAGLAVFSLALNSVL